MGFVDELIEKKKKKNKEERQQKIDAQKEAEKQAFLKQSAAAPLNIKTPADQIKTTTATILDISGNVLEGGLNAVEGVADFGRYVGADIVDLFGNEQKAQAIRKKAKQNDIEDMVDSFKRITQGDLAGKKTQEEVERDSFVNKNSLIKEDTKIFGANARNVLQGMGNTLGYALMTGYLGKATQGINTAKFGGKLIKGTSDLAPIYMSARGSGQTEAYLDAERRGIDITDSQAAWYGRLSGGVEALTESLFGGLGAMADKLGVSKTLGLGKGALDDKLIGAFTNRFRSTLMKNLVDLGVRSTGEGVEEVLSSVGSAFAKKLTYMKDEDLGKLLSEPNYLEEFMSGTLSSLFTQAPANLQTSVQGKEATTGITNNERKVIEAVVESRTEGQDLSNKEVNKVRNEVREQLMDGTLTSQEIDKALGNREIQATADDSYLMRNYVNERSAFTLNEEEQENVKTDKQKTLLDSLSEINNTTEVHNLYKTINAIQGVNNTQQYKIATTEGLFKMGLLDKNADGEYTLNGKKYVPRGLNYIDGDIYVNADVGSKSGTQAVYHEMFEAFKKASPEEYTQFKNMVREIVGSKELQNEIDTYKEMYGDELTDDIMDEIINDKFGELAENEKFINKLADNRSLLEKIIDAVKDMIKYVKGTKEEKELIKLKKNLENKFAEVYKSTDFSKNKGDIAYALSNNALKDVSEVINQTQEQSTAEIINYVKLKDNTIKQLLDYGIRDLPMLERSGHVRENVLTEEQAKNLGFSTKNKHFHGLGVKTYLEIIDSMDNAVAVYQYNDDNNHFLIETPVKINGINSVVPITVEDKGIYNNVEIDFNKIRTSFSPRQDYINNLLKQGKIKEIIAGDNSQKSSLSDNNVSQNNKIVKYSLATDNQGRELSEQQQEYFKDSKVRDDEGRLLEVYHGSPNEFTIFDKNRIGTGITLTASSGAGFYFTDSLERANKYSKDNYKYNTYLNITNPLIVENNLSNEAAQILTDFSQQVLDNHPEATEWMFGNYELFDKNDIGKRSGTAILSKVVGEYGKEFTEYLKLKGYDGIKSSVADYNNYGEQYNYVAFESNQIKSVDNTNPTSNPDIRYSLTVAEANTQQDNNGNKLSKEQQEYFKDSKATDENGNLITVYHTTGGTDLVMNKSAFYEFNPVGTQGYRYGNQTVVFFTDSQDMSGSYVDQNYTQADTSKIDNMNQVEGVLDYYNSSGLIEYEIRENNGTYDLYDVENEEVLHTFKSQDDLFRNITNEVIEYSGLDENVDADGFQYEGYLNLTNPYIIDGKGADWNRIKIDNMKELRKEVQRKWDIPERQLDKLEGDTLKELNRDLTKIGFQLMNDEYGDLCLYTKSGKLAIDMLNVNDVMQEIRSDFRDDATDVGLSTNDIVFQVLAENEMGANYDGVIIKNIEDYGGAALEEQTPNNVYVVFNSNQFKAADNKTPTADQDIRYSLTSNENLTPRDIAPYTEREARYGNREIQQAITPLQNQVQELQNTIEDLKENIAPTQDIETRSEGFIIDRINDLLWRIQGKKDNYIGLTKGEANILGRLEQQAINERQANLNNLINELSQKIINNNEDLNLNEVKEQLTNEISDYSNEAMVEPTITMTPQQIAPTRETTQERDIMEMVDNEGNRKSTTYNQPRQIRQERSALRRFRDTIEGAFINRNVHQDNLARETGNQRIKYKADMLSNVMGEVNYDINNAQTNNQGQEIGKGINGLFAEANSQGLGEVFNDFLINYSNIDRYAQGKGSQTPLEVSQRLVRDYIKQYPQLRAWAEEVWQWSKNERQNLVDAGLIDQELANYLEQIYPHYVPYVSDYENVDQYFEGVGELKPRGIKRAKGNAGKLLSVQDAMARYTYAQKNAVRTNELYSEIVDTLGRVPNFGIDERTDFTNMKDTLYKDSRGQYLTAYRDGKQITTQINAELYNELNKNFENQVKNFEKNMELVLKPIQKINEVRRNILTTWSPTFPITNAIKDIQDALLNSKHTKDMIKNYPSALKELATMNTDQVKQFVALYGSGFTMGEFGQDTMNQKTKNIKFLRKLSQLNEIIELAPRYAEFKASLQKGESLQQAMYNAREITTNFGRGGVITKALNRNGATFLNASVQGFDKLIRNFSGENGAKGVVSSLIKASAFGIVPALFNHLVFGGDDDEEYEALPDYIKDNYYLIKLDDEGNFLRIPKGRMLSVFGSAARRTLEATEGREKAFSGWLENAWNQTGVNNPADNNLFAPLMQAYGSKNGTAWYGGDIVPTRLQDKPKAEQYDESTDKFSIWLGNKLGISPYKLNYVIDQYTGGIGDIVLPTITEEATSDGNILAPIKDKFVVNSTTKSKYVSDFYSKREEMNVKANGSNATDQDKLMSKYLDDISWEMSALYKEKRAIQSDTTLSKKEKFEKAQEIKKEINRLAKVGLDGYKNVVAEDNYAVANDDRGYYKNTKGEWKPIPQNDIETVDGNGLTDFEASNYFKTKNDIYNINEQYSGSKDYEGRRKAIVNAIRSANIPDKAKIELYTRSYKDDMATKYVDAGLSADAYLEFKSQTFTADKDKNGKSISGSKKQKVFDYINSMNIPFEQKVMLAKKEYNTYNEYNPQIINYLNNNPNLEYNDIKEILEDLGFKVDSNGNIRW